MQPVFLIGFMGAGKTTLGNALHGIVLSDGLPLRFIDLDAEIERIRQLTVTEIFRIEGEARFRQLEAETLRSIAARPGYIIACGGGTPCHSGNMEWMNRNGITVHLYASLPVLHRRLIEARHSRPLLSGMSDSQILQFIESKLAERAAHYSQSTLAFCADHLETSDEIRQTRQEFIHLLESHSK